MRNDDPRRSIHEDLVALLPRLRRFAAGLAGWAEDPDDLVQAACERALARLDQFQPGTRLDSWMFRIIQTIWLDGRRRSRRYQSTTLEDLPDGSPGRVDATAEGRLTLEAVRREIARLPEDQRVVLLLVCVEGLTYKETSEVLAIPIGTVMSRLARARFAVVHLLEQWERPDADNVQPLRPNGYDRRG
ncbi:MAG: RNA polymerase sigma factor [Arenicellales bacterium]